MNDSTAQKAPSPDSYVAVWQFVSAHAEVMGGLADNKTASQKSLETVENSLKIIEEMCKTQGAGELSVFFPQRVFQPGTWQLGA